MELTGKFLGIVSRTFKNEDGKEIPWHRLHVWTGTEAMELPLSQQAMDSAMQEGVKFGDELHLKLQSGKNTEGATIYKVVNW